MKDIACSFCVDAVSHSTFCFDVVSLYFFSWKEKVTKSSRLP